MKGAQHVGTNGPVILRNIQFINAYSTAGDQNTAFGAIEITGINAGTTFLVENCTFLNNRAPCAAAMAIGYFDTRDVTITNCTFDGNTATTQGGGAIRIWNNVNNLKFKDTTFKNNYAATYAGAVHLSSSGAGTVFDNCTFTSNQGQSGAGAIHSSFDLTINNCAFRNNSAGSGGAIYSNGGNVLINHTNFYNNNATNEANDNGGGVIFKTSGGHDLTFDYCIFENNYAYRSGGVIYTLGSNTLINNSYGYNNNVKLDRIRIDATKEHDGGVAYVNGAENNFICLNSNFDSGEAYKGGIFYFNGFNNNDKKILIDNCNFTNVYASWSGGAIRFESAIRNAHVYNSRFINGTAYREGGALSQNVDGYTFEYVNLTCINCTQLETGVNGEGGGAIDFVAVRTSLKLENIDFINCSGNKRAGGYCSTVLGGMIILLIY